MIEIPLHEYYSILDVTIPLTRKTGMYSGAKRHSGGYLFRRDDGSEEEEFGITPDVNLEDDIGLAVGHRVSMALFQSRGFFLLYNHANSLWKYYPAAVDDLFIYLADDKGLIKQLQIQRTLKKEMETFGKSRTFLAALDRLRCL